MNNTFNITRFTLLFKKHTLENAKTYLLSIVVLTGLIFLLLGFYCYVNDGHLNKNLQAVTFVIFIFIGGSIFTSMVFNDLGDKKKAIPALTLPASHFEKYLVAWVYSYLIFQVIFIAVFYLVDALVIHMGTPPVDDRNMMITLPEIEQRIMAFECFAFFNALSLCGAIFFEKLHFIKTGFVFFICAALIALLNTQLLHVFIKDDAQGPPFFGMSINDNEHFYRLFPDQSIIDNGWYVLIFVILTLWTSAFYMLKEKEV